MRKIKEFEVSGHKFEAKELTVKTVKALLEGMTEDFTPHDIDIFFPDKGVTSVVVEKSTGVPLDELDNLDLTPSELETIVDKVIEVNPITAGYLKRLAKVGEEMLLKN